MNRIFKNEVQSRFMRIVRQDGVAHDSPQEAETVPASRPTHAGHSAPRLLIMPRVASTRIAKHARATTSMPVTRPKMFLSPNSVRIAALQDQTYCASPSFRSVANRPCAGMMMPVRMMSYVSLRFVTVKTLSGLKHARNIVV